MRRIFIFIIFLFSCSAQAQPVLQPGFSGPEYREMLQILARQNDPIRAAYVKTSPANYHRAYRSPEVGLKNRWELWLRNDNRLAVISIRGTVADGRSWLENFYAAMVPANGELHLNDTTIFSYRLASDSSASVHAGWLLGIACLSSTVLEQLHQIHRQGIRDVIICGHSQGGALAFLLHSYLYYLEQTRRIDSDFVFKTYCSAAPKPGNSFYAYDFDFITRNGWACTVVNTADWVPQTPFSIQTIRDNPAVNPFTGVDGILNRQSFFIRLYLKNKFRKMNRATTKAQQRFERYLGKLSYKQVHKSLPGFKQPPYAANNNYQRAGMPVVLQPDAAYWLRFPKDSKNIFIHHLLESYEYLSKLYYP